MCRQYCHYIVSSRSKAWVRRWSIMPLCYFLSHLEFKEAFDVLTQGRLSTRVTREKATNRMIAEDYVKLTNTVTVNGDIWLKHAKGQKTSLAIIAILSTAMLIISLNRSFFLNYKSINILSTTLFQEMTYCKKIFLTNVKIANTAKQPGLACYMLSCPLFLLSKATCYVDLWTVGYHKKRFVKFTCR